MLSAPIEDQSYARKETHYLTREEAFHRSDRISSPRYHIALALLKGNRSHPMSYNLLLGDMYFGHVSIEFKADIERKQADLNGLALDFNGKAIWDYQVNGVEVAKTYASEEIFKDQKVKIPGELLKAENTVTLII
jgi:hypothetical protein